MILRLLKIIIALLFPVISYAQWNYEPTYHGQYIEHEHYSLCYSEGYEQAVWVAYELTKDEVVNNNYERTDNFKPDPYVTTGSATLADYKGSGYDRGHLAPAADMAFSAIAMSESFYLSNMSPQKPGFNRGIWRSLETLVRTWAVENQAIYVITGGVFKDIGAVTSSNDSINIGFMEIIGPNEVVVPPYFYKIVLVYQPPVYKAIAFIIPNRKCHEDLQHFATTIDSVEVVTGINFFPDFDDKRIDELESSCNLNSWSFKKSSTSYSSNKKSYYTDTENKIDINTASAAELDQLCGIGPAKANAIIQARPYSSIDELTKAKGIGAATLEKIRPYITVGSVEQNKQTKSSSTSKLNINTATKNQLEVLPGIGPTLAQRIIDARPFRSKSDLLKVKGIGPKRYDMIKNKVTL